MPPNNNGSNGECFENQPIMTETSNKPGNLFLEEGTQTEESGASSMTSSTTPNFSDLENGITPMEDSSETESVIEHLKPRIRKIEVPSSTNQRISRKLKVKTQRRRKNP